VQSNDDKVWIFENSLEPPVGDKEVIGAGIDGGLLRWQPVTPDTQLFTLKKTSVPISDSDRDMIAARWPDYKAVTTWYGQP